MRIFEISLQVHSQCTGNIVSLPGLLSFRSVAKEDQSSNNKVCRRVHSAGARLAHKRTVEGPAAKSVFETSDNFENFKRRMNFVSVHEELIVVGGYVKIGYSRLHPDQVSYCHVRGILA